MYNTILFETIDCLGGELIMIVNYFAKYVKPSFFKTPRRFRMVRWRSRKYRISRIKFRKIGLRKKICTHLVRKTCRCTTYAGGGSRRRLAGDAFSRNTHAFNGNPRNDPPEFPDGYGAARPIRRA